MSIITVMKAMEHPKHISGTCAHCGKTVWESLFMLDDCYNVWAGKCPHCKAINMLALTGMRGYSSQGMDLTLPYDEEVEQNNLPADCPTKGSSGSNEMIHGSVSGELCHKLKEGLKLDPD